MDITIGNVVGWLVALIGGSLFQILNIEIGNLRDISVSLQDLVAAFIGSLLFLLVLWLIQRRRRQMADPAV